MTSKLFKKNLYISDYLIRKNPTPTTTGCKNATILDNNGRLFKVCLIFTK
jgi:hypothetical protein